MVIQIPSSKRFCRRDEKSDDFKIIQNVKTRKMSGVLWVEVTGVPDQDGRNKTSDWEGVFAAVPDLREIRLRNPDTFVASGLHLYPRAWEVVLRDHPQAELILDWIQNKVSITQFSDSRPVGLYYWNSQIRVVSDYVARVLGFGGGFCQSGFSPVRVLNRFF